MFNQNKNAFESGSCFRTGILSVNPGGGSSFVSEYVLFEGLFTGKTPEGGRSLVELGSSSFYLNYAFDERFSGREFYDFTDPVRRGLNMQFGCNFWVKKPGTDLSGASVVFRSISSVPGEFAVFDLSGLQQSEILPDILSMMDMVYLVIDPQPARLIQAQELIRRLHLLFPSSEYVINKYSKGINKRELSAFLGTGNYHIVPFMNPELLYRARYASLPAVKNEILFK